MPTVRLGSVWLSLVVAVSLLACAAPPRPPGSEAPAGPAPAGGAAPAAAPAAPQAPSAPPDKITVMISVTSSGFLPHKVAEQRGFFLANGLDAQVIQAASNVSAAAIATGEAEFTGQFPAAIRQRLAGLPILPVAAVVARSTRWLVAMPQYNSVQDLRGKIVLGSSPAGSDTVILRRVLAFHGLDPDRDVTLVHAGDAPARWASIQSGQADAVMFAGGEVLKAREYGMKLLASAAEVIDMPENGLTVNERRLAEQPDLVKRALRALLDAVAFVEREPAEAAKVLAEWTGVDERTAQGEVELLLPALARDLLPSDAGLRDVIEAEKASAGITREIAPSEVTDFTLLHEVLRERGLR
jgi:NitT/TauT family transport system substrate-binding protein